MSEKENSIGQKIICLKLGVGEIVEIMSLQEGGDEFYKVLFPKQNCINYFPLKQNQGYRILASKKVLDNAIEIFKTSFDKIEYSTTQEMINSQKKSLKESDVCKLAKTLSILNKEQDIHPQVSKSFDDTLKTFVEEIRFVTDMNLSEVNALLEIETSPTKAKK